MSKWKGPWQDGRRAWERLNGWHQDSPSAAPGHPDDGSSAVEALADIGLVRHLLDQAELIAVRTARRHGKSWAEIATKLGVTRQSAWERWRDLDADVAPTQPNPESSGYESALDRAASEALIELSTPPESPAPAEAIPQEDVVRLAKAGRLRRRSTVVVPSVIGLSWQRARQLLHEVGLVGIDPDGVDQPIGPYSSPESAVTDQSPESGARVPPGSPVTLWTGRGGGSAGDREPRQPKPSPKSVREMRPEPSDEAIG